jgi:hypothetical protein
MFLDFGLGILSVIAVSEIFHLPITLWFLFWGIFFALLPDADFILHLLQKKSPHHNAYEHRSIFHLPLIYIPLGTILIWPVFGPAFAVLFIFASLSHFLHDSFGIGRGVHWLYPFSKTSYAFIYMHSPHAKWGLWQWIFTFNEKTLPLFDKEHGDDNWIKNIYLSWHPFALLEYAGFIIAIIILLYAY